MCDAAQAPTATLSPGSALVTLPSIDHASKWLSTEPSEASTKRSPATIGMADNCDACVTAPPRPAMATATAGVAIGTVIAPETFASATLVAFTMRLSGSCAAEVRPE